MTEVSRRCVQSHKIKPIIKESTKMDVKLLEDFPSTDFSGQESAPIVIVISKDSPAFPSKPQIP